MPVLMFQETQLASAEQLPQQAAGSTQSKDRMMGFASCRHTPLVKFAAVH